MEYLLHVNGGFLQRFLLQVGVDTRCGLIVRVADDFHCHERIDAALVEKGHIVVPEEVGCDGRLCFDFSLEKTGTDGLAITFSGVLDASQLKGKVGRVICCKLEMNE